MKQVLLALLLAPVLAHASIVKMDFSGSIDSVTFADCTSYTSSSCSAWNFTHPSAINAYNGKAVSVGDAFSGTFQYDTAANYALSSDGFQAVYLRGVTSAELTLPGVKLPSTNMPVTGLGSYSVVDNRYGRDLLMLQQLFQKDDWFVSMSVFLHDQSGTVYTDFSAPVDINSALYSGAQMQLTFLQRSTGDQFQAYGNLSQYASVATPVPEPSQWLFMIGGLAIITLRRYKAVPDRSNSDNPL